VISHSQSQILSQAKCKEEIWRLERQQETSEGVGVLAIVDEYNYPICYEMMQHRDRCRMSLFPCGH
jgi:hypothetical protein